VDSGWLSLILVVSGVAIVALVGTLIGEYEARRSARIEAQREAERSHPV
jgi:hypothetical protein